MFLKAKILDDLLHQVYSKILSGGNIVEASRGRNRELLGVQLELTDPLARVSRSETRGKPFSCLGELLWYLSGRDDLEFIKPYIPQYRKEAEPDGTLYGAYGPRLKDKRGINQLDQVCSLIRRKPSTRRAVIQILDAEDVGTSKKEIPCTSSIQFLVRNERLHCQVSMRSNDAYIGLPHDIFCFTMIQEIVAKELGYDIGVYRHLASSLHIYETRFDEVNQYISEGFQSSLPMPPMPAGSQQNDIKGVLLAEALIRSGSDVDPNELGLNEYWADVVRLLKTFFISKNDTDMIDQIIADMSSNYYKPYLEKRKITSPPKIDPPIQRTFFDLNLDI